MKSPCVYLIEAENGVVKIGCSVARDIRLAAVRTHSPVPARIIAQWTGSKAEEAGFHKRFAAFRSHNEWFTIAGDLAVFVEMHRGLGVSVIEPWADLKHPTTEAKRATIAKKHSDAMKSAWAASKADPSVGCLMRQIRSKKPVRSAA